MTVSQAHPKLDLAVTHLNASVGKVITSAQLAAALSRGSFDAIDSAPAVALAMSMFTELEPRLIALCAYEAGSDLRRANLLYLEAVARAQLRVPAWESAVE